MGKLALAVIILASVLAAGWILSQPRGTDQAQITGVLGQMANAAEEKRAGAVLGFLSEDYRGFGGTKKDVRIALINLFHEFDSIQVVIDAPAVRVAGDRAAAETQGRIAAASGGGEMQIEGEIKVSLRREAHKRFLIYPVKVWRITSAETTAKTEVEDLF